ncbi:MAG: hypothetical protein KJ818_04650, partial [Candidatus Omnitrophica bacterium]|nr:hypothetical protein [Candidatus Omnitrophota bacterium]
GSGSNITIPTLTRPWIVPSEIIIRETPTNAYIYKATLKVMLESDHLRDSPSALTSNSNGALGQSLYDFKDSRLKQLNEYSTSLIKELIIPKLTQSINTSKKYAPLRQVYYSLILAQWFKKQYQGQSPLGTVPLARPDIAMGGTVPTLINSSNLTGLTSTQPWSKDTYFKQYQKSFKDGEYNFKQNTQTYSGTTIRSYFSGGMDLMGPSMEAAIDQNGTRLTPSNPTLPPGLANKCPLLEGDLNDVKLLRMPQQAFEEAALPEEVEIEPAQEQDTERENQGRSKRRAPNSRLRNLLLVAATLFGFNSGASVTAEQEEMKQPIEATRIVLTWPLASEDKDVQKLSAKAREIFNEDNIKVKFVVADINEVIRTHPELVGDNYGQEMLGKGRARAMITPLGPDEYLIIYDEQLLSLGTPALIICLAHELIGHMSFTPEELEGLSPTEEEALVFEREIKFLEALLNDKKLIEEFGPEAAGILQRLRAQLENEKRVLVWLKAEVKREKERGKGRPSSSVQPASLSRGPVLVAGASLLGVILGVTTLIILNKNKKLTQEAKRKNPGFNSRTNKRSSPHGERGAADFDSLKKLTAIIATILALLGIKAAISHKETSAEKNQAPTEEVVSVKKRWERPVPKVRWQQLEANAEKDRLRRERQEKVAEDESNELLQKQRLKNLEQDNEDNNVAGLADVALSEFNETEGYNGYQLRREAVHYLHGILFKQGVDPSVKQEALDALLAIVQAWAGHSPYDMLAGRAMNALVGIVGTMANPNNSLAFTDPGAFVLFADLIKDYPYLIAGDTRVSLAGWILNDEGGIIPQEARVDIIRAAESLVLYSQDPDQASRYLEQLESIFERSDNKEEVYWAAQAIADVAYYAEQEGMQREAEDYLLRANKGVDVDNPYGGVDVSLEKLTQLREAFKQRDEAPRPNAGGAMHEGGTLILMSAGLGLLIGGVWGMWIAGGAIILGMHFLSGGLRSAAESEAQAGARRGERGAVDFGTLKKLTAIIATVASLLGIKMAVAPKAAVPEKDASPKTEQVSPAEFVPPHADKSVADNDYAVPASAIYPAANLDQPNSGATGSDGDDVRLRAVQAILHPFLRGFSSAMALPLEVGNPIDPAPRTVALINRLQGLIMGLSDNEIIHLELARAAERSYYYVYVQRAFLEMLSNIAKEKSPEVRKFILGQVGKALKGYITSGGVSNMTL